MHRSYFFIFFMLLSLVALTAQASPPFPQQDNKPISLPTEKTEEQIANTVQENVSPESTRNNRAGEYALSEVRVTILSGMNQNGGKAYKTDYLVVATPEKEKPEITPTIKVVYKNREDKGLYTVSEIKVKKTPTNSSLYKITATILAAKPEQAITPQVTYEN